MFVTRDDAEERKGRAHALLDRLLDADPVRSTGAGLSDGLEAHGELSALIDGHAVAIVPAWDTSGDWTTDGSVSGRVWLANHTGAHKAAAGALRRTGLLAHRMPHVSGAAAEGRLPLSHLHLHLLTRARKDEVAEVFDRDEAELVAEGQTLTADALVQHLAQWRLRALAELERNDPNAKPGPETENSTVSILLGFQGRGILRGDLTPGTTALWAEAAETRIASWRKQGMLEGDDRSYPELVADALTDLVTDGSVSSRRGQLRPLLIVTATLAALFARAEVTGSERDRWQARIIGGGPIGRAALQELMERANISLVVTTDDGEPLHVGRAQRLVTAAILRVLIARSGGTCEFPGCHAPHHRCQAHHITWWRDGGETGIDNLVLLCKHHHRLVHHGWTMTRGPGNRGLDFRRTNGTPVPQPRYRHGYGHAA